MEKQVVAFKPFTCFKCRRTFKRAPEAGRTRKTCPNCGGTAVQMNSRFRPPKITDHKQWQKIEYLYENGFNFQKVYKKYGFLWVRQGYPQTLEQAGEFVEEFRDQALPCHRVE